MRRTKRGNLRTYALWSPFYDRLIGLAPFRRGRAKAHERLAIDAGERVLFVGVGTGIHLPLLPVGVQAVGVDLSPLILARARSRLPIEGRQIELLEADAQAMPLADATFDAALLSLVLSVVPDAATCLAETLRLLKPGSRAVVFDKFLPNRPVAIRWSKCHRRSPLYRVSTGWISAGSDRETHRPRRPEQRRVDLGMLGRDTFASAYGQDDVSD